MKTLMIPVDLVPDETGLAMLLEGLSRVTGGAPITFKKCFVIESDNVPVIWHVEDLLLRPQLAAPVDALATIPAPKADRKRKAISKERMEKLGSQGHVKVHLAHQVRVRSYKILACSVPDLVGETFTGQGIKSKLRARMIPVGTRLHHAGEGNLVVNEIYGLEKG